MRILVTGGAGFIGSNFVHYWVEKNPKDKIRVIDSLTYAGNIKSLDKVRKKIEFVKEDIVNRNGVKKVMQGVDAVVHFAAESHVDKSILNPEEFQRTNVKGTRVLLEEAEKAGVNRFHHISTDEVFGELPLNSDEKFNENTPYAPRADNFYAISKADADHLVNDFLKESKMRITISNCSNNYGPFQFPEKFIPIIITNLIDGISAPVHGDGLNVRDWIHTKDHSTAVDVILNKGVHGETYLVGSDNDWSNIDIAKKIVGLFKFQKDQKIKHVPDRHCNDRRYAIDATKIKKELGWQPEYTRKNFDKGLKETIDWYRKNEDWWRPLLKRKAEFSDSNKKVTAFMALDRKLGRTVITYKTGNGSNNKLKNGLEKKLVEDKHKTKTVLTKLRSREWYKNTDPKIKKKLEVLSKNPRSIKFVEDIANRPEKIVKDLQKRITKIQCASDKDNIYGIAVWFEVQRENGDIQEEGYYSWGMGPVSGAKILILLKKDNEVSHIALVKDQKFAVGSKAYNLVGGFALVNESIYDLISRKLYKDIGVDASKQSVSIEEVVGLGRIMPDPGMTNNHPLLYAVVLKVDKKVFPFMKKGQIFEKEDDKLVLWPIEKLSELINKADDSYLLSSLTRYMFSGIEKDDLLKKQK